MPCVTLHAAKAPKRATSPILLSCNLLVPPPLTIAWLAASGRKHVRGVATEVRFREISDAEIERYMDKEDALNCAGSARSEGLGVSLLEWMKSDDPTALIGLPLIALV